MATYLSLARRQALSLARAGKPALTHRRDDSLSLSPEKTMKRKEKKREGKRARRELRKNNGYGVQTEKRGARHLRGMAHI
uniref:Uncharacterized protein n=1 Tax=Oryza sativa subsp. japonica TaxID=39947 RepID=Q6YT84_ORYSJ|nr:hypothetical protein [Oryza sativa Japonica Group]BAD31384.1 hypothetical protein [Oryza sativa Japonica Group]